MSLNRNYSFYKPQKGMVLIVVLIMLVVLTVLGVHTMSMATLEGQMSTNSQTMMTTFQSAESAIASTLDDKNTIDAAVTASTNDGQDVSETPPEGATADEIAAWEAAVEAISINNDYEMGKYGASTQTRQLGADVGMEGSNLNLFSGIPIIVEATAEQAATGARTRITQGINYMAPKMP